MSTRQNIEKVPYLTSWQSPMLRSRAAMVVEPNTLLLTLGSTISSRPG